MMNFIDYYHEELEVGIPIPELELEEDESMDEFLIRQRPEISKAIAYAVTLLVDLKADIMPCFAVKDTDLVFNVNRDEAAYSVDRCIEYFEEVEDYEKCILLTNIKTKL
jgi:hypothetical protein